MGIYSCEEHEGVFLFTVYFRESMKFREIFVQHLWRKNNIFILENAKDS